MNQGTYGATPKRALAAQAAWIDQMEAQLSIFMRRVPPDALRESAAELAAFVGAEAQDIAFLDNATVGCNAVLRYTTFARGNDDTLCRPLTAPERSTGACETRAASTRSGPAR